MAPHTNKQSICLPLAFLAVLGCLHLTEAVTIVVKDGNSTCIEVELSALFSIQYDVVNGTRTAQVSLPDSAEEGTGSSCGGTGRFPWLVAGFGDGHALSMGFSSDGSQYRVDNLTLRYNLSDGAIFPESSSKDSIVATATSVGIQAQINTTYRCMSALPVTLRGDRVTITFSNMRMQAYMAGDELSSNETICTADESASTAAPNTTTAAPTTTTTTTSPAPTPPGNPERGNYTVTNDNGTICLLARMGLQLNITFFSKSQNKTVQEIVNLQPSQIKNTGLCGSNMTTLLLADDRTNLSLSFLLNSTSNKYHLGVIAVVATWPDMSEPFLASNGTLEYLRGTLGRSYMCSAEQTLWVVQNFSVNTFRLQVQPFAVSGDQFSAAEECLLDEDDMLIPIIVGAALAGLVLIVLVAYLIGRKRSHAGYQTI